MSKRNKKAFTLVELVIVIAVLIILAAIAIPTVSGVIGDANKASDVATAKNIEMAIKYAIAQNEILENDQIETVGAALEASGLTTGVLNAKRDGYEFYYNTTNDTVTCKKPGENGETVEADEIKLTEDVEISETGVSETTTDD